MNLYLRWGGVALVMLGAVLLNREYNKYLHRRKGEYEGFFSLFAHAAEMIEKYLSYGDGLWSGFSDQSLETCGFLPALRREKSLSGAFECCKNSLALPKETVKWLSEAFGRVGKGYRDGEIRFLNETANKLKAEAEKSNTEGEKNAKVVRALLFGAALAIAVMAM